MEKLRLEERESLRLAGAATVATDGFGAALQSFRLTERDEDMPANAALARAVYSAGEELLRGWPPKPARDAVQAKGAQTVKDVLRRVRNSFGRRYAKAIYRRLTGGYRHFIRAEELVYAAAEICPGLCPTREQVRDELAVPLADKEGVELAQTDFLSHVLTCGETGEHLIHAMLRPMPRSLALLEKFRRDGRLDLGTAQVERQGRLGCVYFNNIRYLNAEDATTVGPLETAVDLVLLDPGIRMGLLRGNRVEHPKYRGRRIFSSGLNLTHLYHGQLPLMFYLTRDLGFTNKLYRGLSLEPYCPEGPENTLEKLWMAALEGFAIGGGCQLLLVLDYVIAEQGAYCNLPARKEGIIPGVAPMRLARFLGQRQAQAGILFDRGFSVDSPEGSSLVNEVLPAAEMDAAVQRLAAEVADSGVVSAGANRKAIRMGVEPLDLFRQYMALYSRDQGDCHFSQALVDNLKKHWVSRNNSGA